MYVDITTNKKIGPKNSSVEISKSAHFLLNSQEVLKQIQNTTMFKVVA